MKRGILFAFLCAFTVGTIAIVLVAAAFIRPQSFHQLLFSPSLGDWGASHEQRSNAEIVSGANRAVVTVIALRAVGETTQTTVNTTLPDNSIQRGTGTGFIIDVSGLVVTNEHVIRNADRIKVRLADGRERKATVIGTDVATDIALLKIEADRLDTIALGDSDAVRVGDDVIAIGNPLEYEHSVTAGIVSAKGRKVYGDQPFEDFIQTDAAINRGNSGGPLLNKSGEVIGVNTVIRVDSRGISFAVPSNVVRRVVEQLQTTGVVERGYLGLMPENLTPEFREGLGVGNLEGVLVGFVSADRPAAKAGIQTYDVLTHFDNEPLRDADDFYSAVANAQPGQEVAINLVRNGRKMTLVAKLDRRPPDDRQLDSRQSNPTYQKTTLPLGFAVKELSPETLQSAKGDNGEEANVKSGVMISDIDPLGPAAEMRWLPGNVILEVNRQPVHNLEDFQKATSNLRDGTALVLRIIQPNQKESRLVALRIGEGR
ncbi:MAG: trypsin-like peptidase domain-containing protein [Acidobacteria bacterium]|nr:trypsin-like peptidase domain-containing protein [Acidobacteriota bacterium]